MSDAERVSRRAFVVGNWKMHKTLVEARALMKGIREQLAPDSDVEVAVCPPFTLLYPFGREVADTAMKVGAQNVHCESEGAFTGEISPKMLKAAGCTYVIVGHSERRQLFGEGGDLLRKKVQASLKEGLCVIFCVGETLAERESGRTMEVVKRQLEEVLLADLDVSRVTVAYEPVWAIGTGRTATTEQAQEVHAFIRGAIETIYGGEASGSMRILYGGSVKPGNAADLMACADVDGALVGGACLVAEDFVSIISAAGASGGR